MAVTPGHQRRGIGRELLQMAINHFLMRGARELFRETNSKLTPALALYESYGFVHAPRPGPSHYERSDIYMVYERGRRLT